MTKPPDYSLGYATQLDLGQQPQAAVTSVRLGLSLQRLRDVGTEAAQVAGVPFDAMTIDVERDASDEPAYFFNYIVPRASHLTGRTRVHLSRELRDRLLALGDAHYPYVKLTSN